MEVAPEVKVHVHTKFLPFVTLTACDKAMREVALQQRKLRPVAAIPARNLRVGHADWSPKVSAQAQCVIVMHSTTATGECWDVLKHLRHCPAVQGGRTQARHHADGAGDLRGGPPVLEARYGGVYPHHLGIPRNLKREKYPSMGIF